MAESESSVSSNLTSSDSDIETINTEELVIFDPTQTFYSSKKDLIVLYTSGKAIDSSPTDWVGLFKSSWQTTHDFSAYQWVPFDPLRPWHDRRRRTIFPQIDIQDISGDFQFLYVTGKDEVIGVSDSFQISDFNPATETALNDQEKITQSLSIISLGSLTSSSAESQFEDLTLEKNKSVSEHAVSKPAFAEPQFAPVSAQKDNWSLSDFVIGSKWRTVYDTLRFAELLDSEDLQAQYEPLKLFCMPTKNCQNTLVEEISAKNGAPSSAWPDTESASAVLVYNKSIIEAALPSLTNPRPPVVLSFCREGFMRSCLELYHQKYLELTRQENPAEFEQKPSSGKSYCHSNGKSQETSGELSPAFITHLLQKPFPNEYQKNRVSSLSVYALEDNPTEKESKIVLKQREPEENDENCVEYFMNRKQRGAVASSFDVNQEKSVIKTDATNISRVDFDQKQNMTKLDKANASVLHGSQKKALTMSATDLRKKRLVKSSKSKTKRSNREVMLQEALAQLTTPQSQALSNQELAENVTGNTSSTECSAKTDNIPRPAKSRKRPSQATTGICKAKRRRINGKKWTVTDPDPCKTEDEGYHSKDDEDEGTVKLSSSSERQELLSHALAEALTSNAELKMQLRHLQEHRAAETEKCHDTSNTTDIVKKDSPSQCAKASTKGKATNTKKEKRCNASSNTAAVAKKDTQSQCSKMKTTGKATNTEKNENCHAASNTVSVPKKNKHSQCLTVDTTGKLTETSPAPSTDTENNRPVFQKQETLATCPDNKPDVVKIAERITEDLSTTTQNSSPLRSTGDSGANPDSKLEDWKVVPSKRMIRIRRLIARKKEELTCLRQNAENYEKRTQALEAQLRAVRSQLSAETTKRTDAEKELIELRTRFWEVLASRKSQPWGALSCSDGMLIKSSKDSDPFPVKPVTFLEPVSFKSPDIPFVKTKSEVRTVHQLPMTLPDSGEVFPGMAIRFIASSKDQCNTSDDVDYTPGTSIKQAKSSRKHKNPVSDLIKSAEILPLADIDHFPDVPVKLEVAKKSTSGAISLKKFLLPAMTAIAETFGSSKSKRKNTATDEHATKSTETLSSSTAVAKVTVSISAETASKKTSSKQQKADKGKKSKKNSGKEKVQAKSCKLPCEETTPECSSDITLCRKTATAIAIPRSSQQMKIFKSPQDSLVPKTEAVKTTENMAVVAKSQEACKPVNDVINKTSDEIMEWRPLTIPLAMRTNENESSSHTSAICEEPVKFCFQKPRSAGKGRQFTYADITAGKLTRNRFAQEITAGAKARRDDDATDGITSYLSGVIRRAKNNIYSSDYTASVPAGPRSPSHAKSVSPNVHQPDLTAPSRLHQALVMSTDLNVHSDKKESRQRQKSSRPPRALHYDFIKAKTEALRDQNGLAKCVTCGMKFSPAVDRYLVEEHIHFHQTFAE